MCRFWWSLLADVNWWDAVGCTQSAAEDGIGKKNVIRSCIPSMTGALFMPIYLCVNFMVVNECFFSYHYSVSLNSVIAVLDADFHALPSMQHRQQHCPVSSTFNLMYVCLIKLTYFTFL